MDIKKKKKNFTTIATEQNGPCYEKLRTRIIMGIMLGIDHVIVIGMNRYNVTRLYDRIII